MHGTCLQDEIVAREWKNQECHKHFQLQCVEALVHTGSKAHIHIPATSCSKNRDNLLLPPVEVFLVDPLTSLLKSESEAILYEDSYDESFSTLSQLAAILPTFLGVDMWILVDVFLGQLTSPFVSSDWPSAAPSPVRWSGIETGKLVAGGGGGDWTAGAQKRRTADSGS